MVFSNGLEKISQEQISQVIPNYSVLAQSYIKNLFWIKTFY